MTILNSALWLSEVGGNIIDSVDAAQWYRSARLRVKQWAVMIGGSGAAPWFKAT